MAFAHGHVKTVGSLTSAFRSLRISYDISQGQVQAALKILGHSLCQVQISAIERGRGSEVAAKKWLPLMFEGLEYARKNEVKSAGHYVSPSRTKREQDLAFLIGRIKVGTMIDTNEECFKVIGKTRGHGRGSWTFLSLQDVNTKKLHVHNARTLIKKYGKDIWINF